MAFRGLPPEFEQNTCEQRERERVGAEKILQLCRGRRASEKFSEIAHSPDGGAKIRNAFSPVIRHWRRRSSFGNPLQRETIRTGHRRHRTDEAQGRARRRRERLRSHNQSAEGV